MKVKKRNGNLEDFDPNKILKRIQHQSKGLKVSADEIAVLTMQGMYDGITTLELDELAASIAHSFTFNHPDYNKLASNLLVSRLQKETPRNFIEYVNSCDKIHVKIDNLSIAEMNLIDTKIRRERDFNFDYFGISQLMKSYLLKDKNGKIIETPQYMYMRVALFLGKTLDEAFEFYDYLSKQLISLATPILFNAGTKNPNMISCNLTFLKGDDINGLFETYKDIGVASSDAAGIGLCIDNLRSSESIISSTNGKAHGWVGLAKIVNELMNVYNQGGKRPGSCALYGSVWHKDIFKFLELKLLTGEEKLRARDIFLAVNVPNNFMKAVKEDGDYYLFCPKDLKDNGIDLINKSNEEFEDLYNKAVQLGIGKSVKAADIYKAIIKSQIETGVPYVHFIDHTNKFSNHSVYGKIKQSNLCIEIMQYSDEDTTSQCCLGSLPVQNFYNDKMFNTDLFNKSVRILTKILNRVIDNNEWSTDKAKKGGLEQRAIAIGIQGFAHLLNKMKLPFDSEKADFMNASIAKLIYQNSIIESNEIAIIEGKTYKDYQKSPYGNGKFLDMSVGIVLQKDLFGKIPLANSLFVAYMPTAGTAQIIGSSESFEPLHTNMFVREIGDGYEFNIINKYLVQDLEELGLWNEEIQTKILQNEGSIQNIDEIPVDIKNIYKTIWEVPQRLLIDLAADRQAFMDQSQSLNLYLKDPTGSKVASMLMYSWEKGLKTGIYYLRSQTQVKANANLGIRRINKPEKPNNSLFNCEGCSA